MAYSVTSWFLSQLDLRASEPQRRFYIGSSDYSDYVLRWPSLRQKWDDVRAQTVTMKMANADQELNFIRENKTLLNTNCFIKFGFTHPTSGDELITMYAGKIDKIAYPRGQCNITLQDKFKQLAERVVGTRDAPVTFTDSALPSDIAWTAVTCYGGLSSVQSTSNTDINWAAFNTWAAVFSADSVYANAYFDGVKVTEVLQRIARYTQSAIFIEEDLLAFARFSAADSNQSTLTTDDFIEPVDVEIEGKDIVNRQYVYGQYSVTSDYWQLQVSDEITSSINSYGPREQVEKDKHIWYVTSTAAANLAARITFTAGEPYDRVKVKSVLTGILRQVGETVVINEPFFGGSLNGGYRVMERTFDMDKGQWAAQLDRSQYGSPFTLDVSALDGTDNLL